MHSPLQQERHDGRSRSGWSYGICGRSRQRWILGLSWHSFYLVQDPSSTDDVAHIQYGSSQLGKTSLEMYSDHPVGVFSLGILSPAKLTVMIKRPSGRSENNVVVGCGVSRL